MDLDRYRFTSTWLVDAAPVSVYRALACLRDYPCWWPEVQSVAQVDDATAQVRCRSRLPYDLVFTTREERRDEAAGVLEARLAGDLDGFSRWTLHARPTGTAAVFEEEVVVTKRLLRALAPVARPAFLANHWLMMRSGERGLRTFVAGMALGQVAA